MNEQQIRKLILEVLLECVHDTSCYEPDRWENDFEYEIREKLAEIELED